MDFFFILYVFICIVIGLGLFRFLTNSGRNWAAFLVLVLSILIFVFYGMRWFEGTQSTFRYSGPWPPSINMCPDYLVYFNNDGKDTCVDVLGVTRTGSTLKPWTRDDNPQNPPADPAKYFDAVYKPGMSMDDLQILCDAAKSAKLTWEGITNGDSCTFRQNYGSIVFGSTTKKDECPK